MVGKTGAQQGELRTFLLGAYSGGGASCNYATKDNLQVASSSLNIMGFTQPGMMQDLLSQLIAVNDGLADRWVFNTRYMFYHEVNAQTIQKSYYVLFWPAAVSHIHIAK